MLVKVCTVDELRDKGSEGQEMTGMGCPVNISRAVRRLVTTKYLAVLQYLSVVCLHGLRS